MSRRGARRTVLNLLVTVIFRSVFCGEETKLVIAISGLKTSLPCNITPKIDDDSPALVLWYKDKSPTPIYTLDARKIPFDQARHSSVDHLSSRAHVLMTTNPPGSLELDPVRESDEGAYRCRVDFKKERTRYTDSKLKVIVPPEKPVINNEKGQVLRSLIGPYNERDRLVLRCEAEGGNPSPSLTWWRESVLLDDTYVHVTNERKVVNELSINSLQRHDLMAALSCQAKNNNISKPLTTTVTVDMNFRPLVVEVQTEDQIFSAGRSTQIVCKAVGSRPAAVITWWSGETRLKNTKASVSVDGNVTTSYLAFCPSSEDDGKTIICRAENPFIADSAVQEEKILTVYYVPKVNVNIPRHLTDAVVKRGHDIFFECHAIANPPVSEIGWMFEGRELHTNKSEGIIVTNHSLVLQGVTRNKKGLYTCVATNVEGKGESEPVLLRIQFPPVCKSKQKVYGAVLDEPVTIYCDVDAEPPEVKFRWSFNGSKDAEDTLTFESNLTSSLATYIPKQQHQYVVLLCWAENEVGPQKDPCVYKIIPSDVPKKPLSCTVNNRTTGTLEVACPEGYSGRFKQQFIFEVYNTALKKLEKNVTSFDPFFTAHDLPPGTLFLISVYSFDQKGKTDNWTTEVSTLLNSNQYISVPETYWFETLKPVLVYFFAITGGLIIMIQIIVLGVKLRKRQNNKRKSAAANNGEENREESITFKNSGECYTPPSMLEDERCPDLIPEIRSTLEGESCIFSDTLRKSCIPKDATQVRCISMSDSRGSGQINFIYPSTLPSLEERKRPSLDSCALQIATCTVHGLSQESELGVKVLPSSPFLRRVIQGEVTELAISEERNTEV
ncbi:hemicentin-1-like [Limulus polyphemus]|uniref:Hemicentin-1-like n=1 Tax=Limulus polyphemus TaxID=6850 RepID=A0ABM1SB35_LIMPO|nr:hemicentin-1-like [Limulus polyphemus]